MACFGCPTTRLCIHEFIGPPLEIVFVALQVPKSLVLTPQYSNKIAYGQTPRIDLRVHTYRLPRLSGMVVQRFEDSEGQNDQLAQCRIAVAISQ